MKKVLQTTSKYIFAAFGIAVLALLMSLTYSALARIFPDSLVNRMWGLVMFDIAAMCWALAFTFGSQSTGQYATSAIGFIVGFIGTLFMVAAEVALSSGQIEGGDIGKWMVYGFIIVTALHAALLYAHHATAPDIHEKINVGIARGEIVTEAINQATKQLDEQKAQLAYTIHNDIVSQVRRDLGLIEADPNMPIIPAEKKRYQQTSFIPAILEEQPAPGVPFQDENDAPS
jgi:apolipoprotein N-acyltransferase